ncbi:hypothetical protein [Pelosinus sp. sgz500959]|uniref:hypothetical protein n=1 Tax=Pelosinus sp. sgz500959 TaxID=3242472 RepID=UPI00366C9C55
MEFSRIGGGLGDKSISVSTGESDAGKTVVLNVKGKIDESMLPTTLTSQLTAINTLVGSIDSALAAIIGG